MRPTDAEIRQYTARKRPASGAGPSRPPKKPSTAAPTVAASATDQSKPVIALSALTVQPEERPAEEATEGMSAASPTGVASDVVREPERHPTASAAATGGAASSPSIPSLPDLRAGAADRGKAPMAPADDQRSGSIAASPGAQVPEGASALADHNLRPRLQLIYTMSELEIGYRRFGNIQAVWKDRATAVEADKAVLVEHLKQSTDREARLVDE
uniref:Uncharacterized protein LOC109505225 n=1 Tax=Elaeis guineensis var. tenera TaxID=51953 RepID=A0A6J0PF59_ELAGV